jgi:hypothetical protein
VYFYFPKGTRIPACKLLTMLAMAVGTWGLIYVAALELWPAVNVALHGPDTPRLLALQQR